MNLISASYFLHHINVFFFSDNMHTKIQPNLWAIFFSRQTVVIPRNILFNMNTTQYYRVDSSVRRNYSVVLHELIKHDLCVKIGSVMGYTALLLHWIKVACIFVLPRTWGNPNFACELSNMNQWLSRFFPLHQLSAFVVVSVLILSDSSKRS